MRLPEFTAEASLGNTGRYYQMTGNSVQSAGNIIPSVLSVYDSVLGGAIGPILGHCRTVPITIDTIKTPFGEITIYGTVLMCDVL